MGRLGNKWRQLQFAAYCFKKGQDDRFVRNVKQLAKQNNLVTVEAYGDADTAEAVYFIDMEESHSGFFAEHNRLLALLHFADRYGMKPVVRFSPGYCYAEKHPVNGTENPFEYYFEQPVGISLEQMRTYRRVFRSRKENSYEVNRLCGADNGYQRSEAYLDEMARITAKYIRLNARIREKMERDVQTALGGGRILGVHVRGTDFKQNFNGHPVKVGVEEYLEAAAGVFREGKYECVFLATDDEEAVEKFQKRFQEKLRCYQDVVRSGGRDTVMHSEATRENHHYLLGYEVLRDMYTLAACDGLVAGLSQVSFAARIQKKSRGEAYRQLVILDKGINFHRNKNCPA